MTSPPEPTSQPNSNADPQTVAPAVDHASEMDVAPVIHAGTGNSPAGLVGVDLVVGSGAEAGPGADVRVHYVGALFTTGEVFDSSWGRGPTGFSLDRVIAGFSQGIAGMRIGGRRELVIPAELGYGAAGAPPVIPGGATLVFVVDLLGIS